MKTPGGLGAFSPPTITWWHASSATRKCSRKNWRDWAGDARGSAKACSAIGRALEAKLEVVAEPHAEIGEAPVLRAEAGVGGMLHSAHHAPDVREPVADRSGLVKPPVAADGVPMRWRRIFGIAVIDAKAKITAEEEASDHSEIPGGAAVEIARLAGSIDGRAESGMRDELTPERVRPLENLGGQDLAVDIHRSRFRT